MNVATNVVDLAAERQRKAEQRILQQQTARHYEVKEVPLEEWLKASIKNGERRRRS